MLRFVVCLLGLFLALGSSPAWASIHHYPEGPNQMMVRSLQTLRDRDNHAWQVVLFKRTRAGQTESIHLRLVGFPDVVAFKHPWALQITTGTEQVWEAVDLLNQSAFSPNVGEYDLQGVMEQLNSNTPLRLALPVRGTGVELLIPPFVVQEWRQVAS